MKLLICFITLFFSTSVYSNPDEFISKLMDRKVDRLTFGLYQCDLQIDETAKSVLRYTENLEDNNVNFASCYYNFDENLIFLQIAFKNKVSNEVCKNYIVSLKNHTGARDNGDTYFIQFFTPSGFADQLSEETDKKLAKYIKYKVGYYGDDWKINWLCESYSSKNKPVLFY